MRDKQFTGYKQVVDLTAKFQAFKGMYNGIRPVEGYIREHKITDMHDMDAVCKIARRLGHNVYKRQSVWYEDGIKIIVL